MSVSKTTTLFNLKSIWRQAEFEFLPISNYLPLNEKYREFEESISEVALVIVTWIFQKTWLGLASLYHIQRKYPKTVYLTEQCQLMSHKTLVHSVRMKMSKTSSPWYRNLIVYSVMHLKLKHVLTAFLSLYQLNAIQMHKCKFFCPKCAFKRKLLIRKSWLDPLFVSVNVISLLFDRIPWKLLQIMHKWLFFNYATNDLCTYVKLWWQIKKKKLPVYLFLPLSTFMYKYKTPVTNKKKVTCILIFASQYILKLPMYLSNVIIHVSIFRTIKTTRFRWPIFTTSGNKNITDPILKKVFIYQSVSIKIHISK